MQISFKKVDTLSHVVNTRSFFYLLYVLIATFLVSGCQGSIAGKGLSSGSDSNRIAVVSSVATDSGLVLTWTQVPSAVSYNIHVANDEVCENLILTLSSVETTVTINLNLANKAFVCIDALDAEGNVIPGSSLIGHQIEQMSPTKKVEDKVSGQVEIPKASLPSGSYGPTQNISLSTETPGAKIFYTTDGSTPTSESILYVSPIVVSNTLTIKALATKTNSIDSPVLLVSYVINGAVVTPTFSVSSGTYASQQLVTFSSNTPSVTFYSTVDGVDPTCMHLASEVEGSQIVITQSKTVKVVACKDGFVDSPIAEATYTIVAPFTYTSVTFGNSLPSAWFGSVAVGTSLDKAVEVHFSAMATSITNPSVTLPAGFSFVGGTYPGTGASCSATITGDCTLAIRFSPTAIQRYDAALTFAFDHDGARQTESITLRGEGALIVGNPDFATQRGVEAGLNGPLSVGMVGTKYFIADTANNRVKLYASVPTASFPGGPMIVLGQPNVSTNLNLGNGSLATATSLNGPSDALLCGGKFFVSDKNNNRVLVWNSMPTTTGQSANLVLGQESLTARSANRGGAAANNTLSAPYGLACYTVGLVTMLFVSDSGNHRVLVWSDAASVSMGGAANQVLGQADFASVSLNRGATVAANTLRLPTAMTVVGGKLFVVDSNNHRVLAFNLPASDTNLTLAENAAFSLGQSTLTTAASGASAMMAPEGVASDGTSLVVGDANANRVLVWTSLPTAYAAPNFAIGQVSLAATTSNKGAAFPDANSLFKPRGVAFISGKIHIADTTNNRIFVVDGTPTAHNATAELIIGQTAATHVVANSPATIDGEQLAPLRLYADPDRLIVADGARNRVLIWNSFPTSNNESPDIVLGQADFASATVNRGGTPSCASMSNPSSVFWDGSRLYVGDEGNHRVLVWNEASIATGAPADVVLGQASCSAIASGNTASRFNAPRGVYAINGTLFVTDTLNGRVQGFTISSLSSSMDATFTIKWTTTDCSSVTDQTMSNPEQVFSDGTKLFIPERGRHRISVFSAIPTAAGCPDYILGQPDGSTVTSNNFINSVGGGVFDADGSFYMLDRGNNLRIEKWISTNLPTSTSVFPTPDAVWGALGVDNKAGMYDFSIYGGYGYTDGYTPAIVGNKLVVPDRSGRVYIVPKP
jgi:hypothetical protein